MLNNEISYWCEKILKKLILCNPQINRQGNVYWVPNGSTISNILCNVKSIDGIAVSDSFKKAGLSFVRRPKGDIDVSKSSELVHLKLDESDSDMEYFKSNIAKEYRKFNFIDFNGTIDSFQLSQLCEMETEEGLKIIAKKPQYIMFYKFSELMGRYQEEVGHRDFKSILNSNSDIVNDVTSLISISKEYCGVEEIIRVLDLLKTKTSKSKELYETDEEKYYMTLNNCFDFIANSKTGDLELTKEVKKRVLTNKVL